MRRVGRVKMIFERSGGGGKLGVDGMGSGLDGGGARRRGVRRGSLVERSADFTDFFDLASAPEGAPVDEGMVAKTRHRASALASEGEGLERREPPPRKNKYFVRRPEEQSSAPP